MFLRAFLAVPNVAILTGLFTLGGGIIFRHSFRHHEMWLWLLAALGVIAAVATFFPLQTSEFVVGQPVFENSVAINTDFLPLIWLPLSLLLVLTLFIWPHSPGVIPRTFRREAISGWLLAGVSGLLALAGNPWHQWGCLVLCGWLLCFVLGRDTSDGERGRSAAACLIWFTIADFLWLLGLTMLELILPTSLLSDLTNPKILGQLSKGAVALTVTSLMLMTVSLMLRCGLYPLMSWMRPAAISCRDTAWIIGFGMGPAMIVLLRWQPALTFFSETRLLVAGIGGLSAMLLAVMAWAGNQGPARLVHLAAGQMGLIWLGLAAADNFQAARVGQLLFALLWFLPIISLGFHQTRTLQGRRNWGPGMLFLFSIIALSGVLGQEQIFEAVRTSTSLESLNPWLLLGETLFAQGLMAMVLFREIQMKEAAPPDPPALAVPPTGVSALGWTMLALLSLLVTGLCASVMRSQFNGLPLVTPPIMSGLVCLIGLIASRTWPTANSSSASSPPGLESIKRLAQAEYYVPIILKVGFLLPIRAAAQISRFLEWFVIGQLVQKLPAGILHWIGDQAAHADEAGSERERMWQCTLAAVVMLIGVIAGTWL